MEKNVKLFAILLFIVVLSIGGTITFYFWTTREDERTKIRFSIKGAEVIYNSGNNIMDVTLNPTNNKENGIKKDIDVNLSNSNFTNVKIAFNLTLDNFSESLQDESFKWEFYKNGAKINEGNFNNSKQGDLILLTSNEAVTTVVDHYELYLWIDGNVLNPTVMQAKDFSFKISASATDAMS